MFPSRCPRRSLPAMSSASSNAHFDPVSRAFHWLTAIVIVAAFTLGPEHFGRLMRDGLDPATRWDIVWHESLGVSVFVLTLLRLVWVALRPASPRFEMNPWLQRSARLVQGLLWLLMLLLPVTALLALGSEGHPLTLLGGVRVDQMPLIANSPLADAADWGDVHGFLGDTIVWLAGAHALAAIYHHVVLKDGVLKSMLPRR
ncbi:cytochrome b [Ideonella dechloratans]|uniref:cytochrome b n=1 Tax=Ideonella dechloratans TaxID=36863 RepID=UPI0035B16A57